jgi:hypothetical protein
MWIELVMAILDMRLFAYSEPALEILDNPEAICNICSGLRLFHTDIENGLG